MPISSAANGSIIHLITAIKLPVTIGKYTIHRQFWVAADTDCPAQLLLASDFIRQLNKTGLPFSLDLHKHIITIGQEHHNLVQVHSVTLREEASRHVTVDGTTTLSLRTTSVIRTRIHGFLPGELNEFLIEDNYRPADDLYIVGRTYVSPNTDGTCFINVINPSNTDILLKDKMKVAWATPALYSEVQILAVHSPHHANEDMTLNTTSPEAD
ncbi:unnamed protein product [Heligmosomoides polygyrus]|uniref:Uncharacterized protein n=1 Tax=Heligmosomoides polygyrus TaxID=6339 RepID=A0A183FY26_HELPZ|nr:unnamed protein product [Heligmosomoides polygyrus]